MRVIVVGAGVLGLWTALWLRRRGHEVIVVDKYGPGSPLASSTDETRISRSSHGRDEHYPAWQRRALLQWRALARESGVPLFDQTGVLWFAYRDDGFETASLDVLPRLGIPVERWRSADIATRNDAIRADDLAWALFEPEGGVVKARRAIAAVVERFSTDGGTLRVGMITPDASGAAGESLGQVRLSDGATIDGDAFVFACGPWLPGLFPDVLGDTIAVPRRDVIHFATPPGDVRFRSDVMPTWIDYDKAMYGCPSIEYRGFKCCPDWSSEKVDPDHLDRRVSDEATAASRRYMRTRFPDMAEQPLAEGRVCQYEATPDDHFVIDRHPAWQNAWIVGGGSGHAFKHGPVIGEYVSALIHGDLAAVAELQPPDRRFALGPRTPGAGMRTNAPG